MAKSWRKKAGNVENGLKAAGEENQWLLMKMA